MNRGLMALIACGTWACAAFAQSARPVPRTEVDGVTLGFEFPGLLVGIAEYDEGPTGVTAFVFPRGVTLAVDVRGGGPGTLNTDALRQGYDARTMRAVVFTGGSWHGLSAATGVANELREQARDSGGPLPLVGVTGAVINDVAGGRRLSGVMPDDALGRAAVRAARPGRFPLGARGAGRFAMIGSALGQAEPSGQGGAVRRIGNAMVAVFTVVNSAGFVVDRTGGIARCRSQHFGEPCSAIADLLRRRIQITPTSPGGTDASADAPTSNTTLTLVLTNQRLTAADLQRIAIQVHTSMGRALQPFSTASDGDVLFAATTAEVDNEAVSPSLLALAASELAWDAVLAALPPIEDNGPVAHLSRDAGDVARFHGAYELGPGSRVRIASDAGTLRLVPNRPGIMYFPQVGGVALDRVGVDEFRLRTPRRDRVRFTRSANGDVAGLELNPGTWAIRGKRTAP